MMMFLLNSEEILLLVKPILKMYFLRMYRPEKVLPNLSKIHIELAQILLAFQIGIEKSLDYLRKYSNLQI